METITIEQAIERGFTHFVEEEGENVIPFKRITEDQRKYYKDGKYYIVDMTEPMHYRIDADTIKELISDYVSEQDTCADEDGKLIDICQEHDYSQLANELNEKFKVHKYFEPIDILVTF